jgi:putative membrane protein
MPSEPPPPPPGPAADDGRFAPPQTLHPVSIVLGVPVAQLLQALLFPAAAVVATGGSLTLAVLGVVMVVGTIARAIAWQRFRWSFDGRVLRVSSGVLSRTHRSIDVGRIQQVEIDRPFAQRLVGVASVRIETAGSSAEPGVELRVLREADAVALREAVRTSAGPPGPAAPAPVEILRVPLRHVALAAVTGAQLFVLPAVLGAAFQLFGGRATGAIERAVQLTAGLVDGDGPSTPALVALAVVALVAISAVLAVGAGLLRDGRFRIEQVGSDLLVRRGLLGTRDSTVPLDRIQMVHVVRNPVRRLLRVTTVRIHSATGDGDRRVTVPLVPDTAVGGLLDQVLGAGGLPRLEPHPRTARRRALWRWYRRAALLAALPWIALLVLPEGVGLAALARAAPAALLVGATVLAIVEWRALGHGVDTRVIASRRGALSLTTSIAPLVKIQAVSTRATVFQRRLGLVSLTAHTAGSGGDLEVLDVGEEQAAALHPGLVAAAAGAEADPSVAAARVSGGPVGPPTAR